MQCSGLEFVLGIADHGSPVTQNQDAVAAFAEIGPPLEWQTVIPGIAMNPPDELVPSHLDSVGQICPIVNNLPFLPAAGAKTVEIWVVARA